MVYSALLRPSALRTIGAVLLLMMVVKPVGRDVLSFFRTSHAKEEAMHDSECEENAAVMTVWACVTAPIMEEVNFSRTLLETVRPTPATLCIELNRVCVCRWCSEVLSLHVCCVMWACCLHTSYRVCCLVLLMHPTLLTR